MLTVYWLVSGYGLRAWRALAWLLVVLLTATVALRAVGFTDHRQSWSSALLYTAGTVTRLVNPPDGLLTEPGQAIRLVVGLLGPILLALALLELAPCAPVLALPPMGLAAVAALLVLLPLLAPPPTGTQRQTSPPNPLTMADASSTCVRAAATWTLAASRSSASMM